MQIFVFDNIVVGLMIFVLGFIFHWLGQLISVLNWEYAKKIGLQEKKNPPEFKVYEHAIAVADVLLGWVYIFVAIGLIVNAPWAYPLAMIPGTVFIYHGLFFWVMKGNQNKSGHRMSSNGFIITWTLVNLITGILAVVIAL